MDTIESIPNFVGFESFVKYFNYNISTTSYGQKYLILEISSIIDDKNPFLIIPKTSFDEVAKMKNDYSINKRYLTTYTSDTHFKLATECLNNLQTCCKLFINRYIKQTASLRSVDVIADEGFTRPYLILSTSTGIKFILSDDYDNYESIRCGIMTNRDGFNSLRRVVYSFNTESIELFEKINRSSYNSLVLNFLNLSSFECVNNHTIINTFVDNIWLLIPTEFRVISKFINLPFVSRGNDFETHLIIPKRLLISKKTSFVLIGKWSIGSECKNYFPIKVNFDSFFVLFYNDHFDIIPNDGVIIIEQTNIVLPFKSKIVIDLSHSCASCFNYHEHYKQCLNGANNLSIASKCLINNKRFTWTSICIKNFKDSANLVRSGSLSIIDAIAKLCNVVLIKYSNKFAKINPYIFLKAYDNYLSLNIVDEKIDSFEDFMKLFDSLDEKKSYFVTIIADDNKQIDIFKFDLIEDLPSDTNIFKFEESDRNFCYFGLYHNIKRFVFFVKKLSSIFVLPERCPIEIMYDGLLLDSYIRLNSLVKINSILETCFSNTEDCFDCDKWQATKSIGPCKDFFKSTTPYCEHGNLFIKRNCIHCRLVSDIYCDSIKAIMNTCGFKFEDVIPIIIPRIEKTCIIVPILLKPNGLKGNNFGIIVDELFKLDNTISIDSCTTPDILSFQMFKELYPSAATNKRKFSKHWHCYMTSDVTTIVFLRAPNLELVRQAMLNARKVSNIEWTKNIVHSAENDDELDLFFTEIQKLDREALCEPLMYPDGTTKELSNRKIVSKH